MKKYFALLAILVLLFSSASFIMSSANAATKQTPPGHCVPMPEYDEVIPHETWSKWGGSHTYYVVIHHDEVACKTGKFNIHKKHYKPFYYTSSARR